MFDRDIRSRNAQEAAAIVLGAIGDQGPWGGRTLQLDPWLHNRPISVTVECLELDKLKDEVTINVDPKIWTIYGPSGAKGESGDSIPGSEPAPCPCPVDGFSPCTAEPPVVSNSGGAACGTCQGTRWKKAAFPSDRLICATCGASPPV